MKKSISTFAKNYNNFFKESRSFNSKDIDLVLNLLDQYDQNQLESLTYKKDDLLLSLQQKNKNNSDFSFESPQSAFEKQPMLPLEHTQLEDDLEYDVEDEIKENEASYAGEKIKATMNATFYLKPTPESDDFVKEGDKVEKGQILCLLEAMKLFTEIKAPENGVISRIHSKQGELVDEGQVLFDIVY